jgi:hypothetical protein
MTKRLNLTLFVSRHNLWLESTTTALLLSNSTSIMKIRLPKFLRNMILLKIKTLPNPSTLTEKRLGCGLKITHTKNSLSLVKTNSTMTFVNTCEKMTAMTVLTHFLMPFSR